MAEAIKGFAVQPKLDCPHVIDKEAEELVVFLTEKNDKHFSQFQCTECHDKSENWICIECQTLLCSRYVNSHMVSHNNSTKHPIALSFSDASFWCYECDSYIEAPCLKQARFSLSKAKFSSAKNQNCLTKEEEDKLAEQMSNMKIQDKTTETKQVKDSEKGKVQQKVEKATKIQKQPVSISLKQIVQNIKNKVYKNVVFLTGAGISVAAGIPDFRSPNTGLYSKMQKYNLPKPQAVFQIQYFKSNPEPFLKMANQFLTGQFNPTIGHKFIKKFEDENMLRRCLTQNIDDLEIKVGLSEEKLIQAHGHGRSAHCITCKKEHPVEVYRESIAKMEVLKCQCGGYVKPDIVFFGEQLPSKFMLGPQDIQSADLVIVIGTALAVMPFAFLTQLIKENVPLVLINNTDSLTGKDKVWLKGDIQQECEKLMKEIGWM